MGLGWEIAWLVDWMVGVLSLACPHGVIRGQGWLGMLKMNSDNPLVDHILSTRKPKSNSEFKHLDH